MPKDRKRIAIVTLVIVSACSMAAYAGNRFGLFDRLTQVRSEWLLRSRVKSLWEARVAGDLEKSSSFVIASGNARARLGKAVRYLGYEVKQVDIKGDEAEVRLEVMAQIDFPGLPKLPADGPQVMKQRWVREGSTWYWDPGPGPAPEPSLLMKPVVQNPSQGEAPQSGE